MTNESPVAFLVANDRHHSSAAAAVIEALRKRAVSCRVLSMSELRGLDSPARRFRDLGVPLDDLVPFRFRGPSAGSSARKAGSGSSRGWLRELLWHGLLSPSLRECLEQRPALVVLPNDGAYPYDRVCDLLTRLGIPFLVLQEGIRFTTSAESREGRSGAAAWAVWGNTSARYFRDRGAAAEAVHVTGSPRFDELLTRDWSERAHRTRAEFANGKPILALLSNPIDDLGYVTTAEKIDLIRRISEAAVPLLAQRGLHLVIKLHQRESVAQVKGALSEHFSEAAVTVVSDCPLYPLLFAARGAITFASSVGLEALLCGLPLAVVEIPGHGFLHDFVDGGAARGISWKSPVSDQLRNWLEVPPASQVAVSDYLDQSVAHRGDAAEQVAALIARLVGERPSPSI